MWDLGTARLSALLAPLLSDLRESSGSRVRVRGERAHIAVRGLAGPQGGLLAVACRQRLSAVPGVRWAAVNRPLGHAVVAVDGPLGPTMTGALADAVDAVESEHAVDGPLPGHPLSPVPTRHAQIVLAAHLAALPVAVLTRLATRTPVPTAVVPVLSALDALPRLRHSVEHVLGLRDTSVTRALLGAAAHAGSGLSLGLGVDAARHVLRLTELLAQQAAWQAAEPRLTDTADRFAAQDGARTPREVPLRAGPVERYADRAQTVAVGAFGGALAMTGRPLRAVGAAVSVIPKAPWLAREAFASVLARGLSRRGLLVTDTGALRRLDRVDVALLDTEALMTGGHQLTDLALLDGEDDENDEGDGDGDGDDRAESAAAAHKLFDPRSLDQSHEDGPWRLDAVDRCPLPDPTRARSYAAYSDARTRLERNGARRILGLVRDGRLVALVGVVPEADEASSALVRAARRAGLEVLITRGDYPEPPGALAGERTAEGGERLVDSVRAAQRNGSGVLLVSRHRAALAAADIGVGLTSDTGAPPWGADVHAGMEPGRAAVLLAACASARSVSGWGVRLAQTSAGLGVAMTAVQTARRPLGHFLLTVNGTGALGMAAGVWSAARVLARPDPVSAARAPWHVMDPATALARIGSREQGLTAGEAGERLRPSGRAAPRPSLGRAFVTETANPLTPVLVGGAALSAAVGAVLDASMILAVTGVSGLIGGVQRYLADRTAARLYLRAVIPARVVRDGEETEIAAERLVAGDVVTLRAGDAVPADARLLVADGVEADESALTGESLPVAKSAAPALARHPAGRTSMVHEGTTLAAGHARAVVVATGEATEAGRSAEDAEDAPRTGVERRLARITRAALPAALASAGAVVAAGLFRGRPVRETIGAAVGLAVASVPEGLPFLVTAAQLAAARRLAEHGVLVRNARTIEAAGRTDVLCFDKTGTLTHGRLELVSVHARGRTLPLSSREPHHRAVLAAGLRATPRARGSRRLAHATDRAVAAALRAQGVRRDTAAPGWKATASLAFEPSRGFHAVLGHSRGGVLLSVKGAPEQVVERCTGRDGRPLDRAGRQEVLAEGEKLAGAGHRVLAVAERRGPAGTDPPPGSAELADEDVDGLEFLGFLALVDQVRGGAGTQIARLADAGVHIVMITGDHPDTAEAIARELGVVNGHHVVSGTELDHLDDDKLTEILPTVGVVARATPHHKVRVVQAFQRMGRTVAMTGDGANDAPAIRLADVGIAFGSRSTPAARAAADLVVTNGRIEPVLVALIEGRALWVTVRQALSILVGGNLGEIAFAVTAATLTGQSPLTARQLLLVNLFTDLVPAVAVATRTPRGPLDRAPLKEGPEVSLGAALARETGVRAGATALAALAGWLVARRTGRPARARTIALLCLVGAQLGQTLLTAPRSPTVLAAGLGSAAALAAVVQTPGVSRFFGCTPLGPVGWATAAFFAAAGTAAAALAPRLLPRLG